MDLSMGGGLLGLLHAILVIYVIVKIVGSSAGTGAKVFWILLVLLLPLVGFIAWLVAGPKS